MRQKFLIFAALIALIIVLVGLNAASYTQKEKEPDTEFSPNRSSWNAGATGTRAFYELLSETGRKPVRWQQPPNALLSDKNAPETFVVIGSIKRQFTDTEARDVLRWVSGGGKLVIIDREPPPDLITTTANWKMSFSGKLDPEFYAVDPSDAKQMTEKTAAAKPIQPTVYTKNVNAVQPSKFASSVVFERFSQELVTEPKRGGTGGGIGSGSAPPPPPPPPPAAKVSPTPYQDDFFSEEQLKATPEREKPPTRFQTNSESESDSHSSSTVQTAPEAEVETPALSAPVVHLTGGEKNILVDAPFGSGRIVYLSDPYIVSNAGINLVDNAHLAVNVVASSGAIGFDEYHQGFGANSNRLFQYFDGTPVVAIFLQLGLLAGLILLSQSRGFARALPENEPNRLSKLEYVAAMAELQRRTKAFDLAIENIYTDFRRRAAKLVGADVYTTPRDDLAKLIAERGKFDGPEIAGLMRQCEDIMHGEPTDKKEVLQIAGRLREIEEKLGLKRAR